ncbi:nucleotidyl transferase AbiEii/AbiGii toxin family protein [bacterium]|nr:nucleotidyl transferase AbiEii/AbiGii toxin family protein [bacterium]
MTDTLYHKQASLLLQVLPYIARESSLALKGGTAINFFIRDLPRLSVDIDLCYLPIKPRVESFQNIGDSIDKVTASLALYFPQAEITPRINGREKVQYGFYFRLNDVTIKIETNYVFRGSVFPAMEMELSQSCQSLFNTTVKIQTLTKADLYGGKICAALDRQHPRDLFDILDLLKNEGLSEQIRQAFIVYLISHPRPLVEILNPNVKDIQAEFEHEFIGMTDIAVSIDTLKDVRKTLIDWVKSSLTKDEKEFLWSFKNNRPDWSLLPFDHIETLPSVKWKLQNIASMSPRKHSLALKKLGDWLNK